MVICYFGQQTFRVEKDIGVCIKAPFFRNSSLSAGNITRDLG